MNWLKNNHYCNLQIGKIPKVQLNGQKDCQCHKLVNIGNKIDNKQDKVSQLL